MKKFDKKYILLLLTSLCVLSQRSAIANSAYNTPKKLGLFVPRKTSHIDQDSVCVHGIRYRQWVENGKVGPEPMDEERINWFGRRSQFRTIPFFKKGINP